MVPRVNESDASHHLQVPWGKTTKYRSASPYSEHGHLADDERSSTSAPSSRMAPMSREDDADYSPPSYPGEDTRPTSKKELLGFYTYSFAAEVYVVCGLGAFIPITLEGLARASPSAVLADDRSQPCQSNGLDRMLRPRTSATAEGKQCVVNILGAEVNTASFAMYTFSISVLLQALVVVTMSGAADHGRFRKTLMMSFAVIGSVITMLYLPINPNVFVLSSIWAIIGNVCFGASFVLLNSFLPLLVRNHPATRGTDLEFARDEPAVDEESTTEANRRQSNEVLVTDVIDPAATLLPSDEHTMPYPPSRSTPSAELQLSTKISSYGVGIGYSAAVILQILSLIVLTSMGASLLSLRVVLFMVGLWWLVFTIPAAIWLRPRPGPPLAFGDPDKAHTWLGYLTYSWANLGRTILRARRLKDVLLFLAAWFMISDAIATVSGTAILFAKTTLGMDASALALVNVIVTLSGIVGALCWSKISRIMNWKPSQTILTCICLFELIPLYGLLGYIPAIQRLGSFGLQQAWEMYPLGAVYGLVLGGLSSYCRSLYGELIPPGSEAAFYALYAITDKGSSVFGPAIVGAITDATGDIRPAFWFLAVLIGLPIPIMLLVSVERGKVEGAKLSRETLSVVGDELSFRGPEEVDDHTDDEQRVRG